MKNRRNKLVSLTLVACLFVSFTACGTKNESTEEVAMQSTVSQETESEVKEEEKSEMGSAEAEESTNDTNLDNSNVNKEESKKTTITEEAPAEEIVVSEAQQLIDSGYYSISKFSEDRQWLISMPGSPYWAFFTCIDQNGQSLFRIESNDLQASVTSFSNNSAFLETKYALYQIGSDGDIISTFSLDNGKIAKAYKDGQVWIEEYSSGFDSAGFTFTLYENGEEITSVEVEGTEDPIDNLYYFGKGVWYISYHDSEWNRTSKLYFSQNNTWLDTDGFSAAEEIYFYDDIALLGTSGKDKIVVADYMGNVSEIDISTDLLESAHYVPRPIKDGYCIIEDYKDHILIYDFSANKLKLMDNKYAESVDMERVNKREVMVSEGCVALPLTGKDGNSYVALFDTSWEIIVDPIQCRSYSYSDGKLIVAQEEGYNIIISVYNNKGKKLYDSRDKNYYGMYPYENGISYAILFSNSLKYLGLNHTPGYDTSDEKYTLSFPAGEFGKEATYYNIAAHGNRENDLITVDENGDKLKIYNTITFGDENCTRLDTDTSIYKTIHFEERKENVIQNDLDTDKEDAKKQNAEQAEWQQAYYDFLQEFNTGDESAETFALLYIDGDDIPELVMGYNGTGMADQVQLFTYYQGEVRFLGDVGEYSTLEYVERANLIHDRSQGRMKTTVYVRQIVDGTLEMITSITWNSMDGEDPGEQYHTYFPDGQLKETSNIMTDSNVYRCTDRDIGYVLSQPEMVTI